MFSHIWHSKGFDVEYLLTQQFDHHVHNALFHAPFAMDVDVFFTAFGAMTILIKKFPCYSSTFLNVIRYRTTIKKKKKKKAQVDLQ